jgi:HK97 family phage major capsid protein
MSQLMEEVKSRLDELKTTWEEYKTQDALREAEIKQLGEATAETKQTLENLDAKLDEKVDEINVRMQKLNLDEGRASAGGGPTPARVAYEKLIRGPKQASQEERALLTWTDGEGNELEPRASMIVSDDTEGGFLAPEEVVGEIIKGVVEFSPMRSVCRVRSTSRISVKAPKRTQVAGAVWVGEAEARSETQNPKYGKEEISTRELHAMADISRQDLEDSAFELETEVYGEFSEQFGVSEGAAFVSGDGVDGKPEGFLTAADTGYLGANGIKTVTSTTNDVIKGDDFINVYYELKEAYARNGTWVLRRSTVRDARKLKDLQDNYIWQPGLAGLAPATILDRPYVEAIDMPAVGDGALAVAFGDWRRGYWIVDRIQIETLRDPYTQGPGFVRLWARKRVGGQTVLPEAIKLLKIA